MHKSDKIHAHTIMMNSVQALYCNWDCHWDCLRILGYIETSTDGVNFHQMRAFHLVKGDGEISFGLYAASPVDHSFTATFTEMKVEKCKWETWSAEKTGFNQTSKWYKLLTNKLRIKEIQKRVSHAFMAHPHIILQKKHAVTSLSQHRQYLSTLLQPRCNNAAVPLQP